MWNKYHRPVLLKEVIKVLGIEDQKNTNKPSGKFIDATLGAGGYAKAILDKNAEVLGIDIDESMIKITKNINNKNFKPVHGNFKDIKKIAEKNGFTNVDGIVFDLGVSSVHFNDKKRGFSFRAQTADLDMRLDPNSQNVKAKDLLNLLREDQLEEIFGKPLARKIVEFRKDRKFDKVKDFLSLFPKSKNDRIHPATVPMMKLRIAVNSELKNLEDALPQAWELLKSKGKLVVVTFHSLEDRIVKNFFKEKGAKNNFIKPTKEEIISNPKARSAKLRFMTK